ncbi:uncharacterized protein LOC128958855 [Oppia nitens]|uniref:uncharacterized protein LOC128958855 n=1 Tax=Oppia nitens TaxID=1686743 RepID=UPI0023DA799E|nr:uncharacterized protein LOC128958855 [Oppia nitens]
MKSNINHIFIFYIIFTVIFGVSANSVNKVMSKKSAKECFKVYRKDVEYVTQVLEQRSLSLNQSFESEKGYMKTTIEKFRRSLDSMDRLYDQCRVVKFADSYCLHGCQTMSSEFARYTVYVFQLLLAVDRYDKLYDTTE